MVRANSDYYPERFSLNRCLSCLMLIVDVRYFSKTIVFIGEDVKYWDKKAAAYFKKSDAETND